MGNAEVERAPEDFTFEHRTILERLIPEGGLLLPENPILMRGTTGLKILIYDFGESNLTNIPGEISQVYPELIGVQNMLVLKMRGDKENVHPYFANNGLKGNEIVDKETDVDQRVLGSGLMPSALGKGRVEEGEDGSYLVGESGREDDERTIAMVMLYYDTEFCDAIGEMGREERMVVMEQAIELLFAFERDVPEDKRGEYEGLAGVKTIIKETFRRAKDWYQIDPKPLETLTDEELYEKEVAEEAGEEFAGSFSNLIADEFFQAFIESEVEKKCFVDTHGDLRPHDNANMIRTSNEANILVFRDPVRLFRKKLKKEEEEDEGGEEEGEWSDFHLTHRAFQLGLLTGRLYTENNMDMISCGVGAYLENLEERGVVESRRIEDLSKQDVQMIGLSMCYGIFVEILVARGMMRIGEYNGPEIVDYWKAVQFLAEDDFKGWLNELK